MKKEDLKLKLLNESIPSDSYCLDGGFPNEALCLNNNGEYWEVYYSERGNKTGLIKFESEVEACGYFYNKLLKTLRDMGYIKY